MDLGERLKQARLDAGLSQRQLCGEQITRNMLSQIENGSAKPSMSTLAYLAKRLDKPISFFLEEEAVLSPNQTQMDQARQAYEAADFSLVLTLLEQYQAPDHSFDREKQLLEALAQLSLARNALAEGKHTYAAALLKKAAQAGASTPYFTPALERERLLMLYTAVPSQAKDLAEALPPDDRELLLRAEACLSEHRFSDSHSYLNAVQDKNAYWQLMAGKAALGEKDYVRAKAHFLAAEQTHPTQCYPALETCFRELEDYKMAYHYACKQREG